jgi:hypothetical protein
VRDARQPEIDNAGSEVNSIPSELENGSPAGACVDSQPDEESNVTVTEPPCGTEKAGDLLPVQHVSAGRRLSKGRDVRGCGKVTTPDGETQTGTERSEMAVNRAVGFGAFFGPAMFDVAFVVAGRDDIR